MFLVFSFFFQAEDGIRDDLVTGVQTCALPIWVPSEILMPMSSTATRSEMSITTPMSCSMRMMVVPHSSLTSRMKRAMRSEERRVGKECRSRWSADQYNKKQEKTWIEGECRRDE